MKKLIYIGFCLAAAVSIFSCARMDDYLKYAEGIKHTYIGRPDSVAFNAGHNRIQFYGRLSSDPKVAKIGIFWNNGTKSLYLDVDHSEGNIVEHMIDIGEGSYNFEVYTYDAEGNNSVMTSASGVSYGGNYTSGLFNRVVKECYFSDGDIVIEWYSGSDSSPYTIVTYEDADGTEQEVRVEPKDNITTLENPGTNQFSVLSYYLPEKGAVDMFTPDSPKLSFVTNITSLYIKNPGPGIEGTERVSWKWGVPKDWNLTDNVRNQTEEEDGQTRHLGGWSSENDGCIHVESQGWNGPGFDNGKIWQSPTLQAGTYDFTVKYLRGNTSDGQTIHLVAAADTILPDRDDLADDALAYRLLGRDEQDREHTIRFTLDEPTEVSMGLLITLDGDSQYLQFTYFKLMQVPEE